MELLKQSIFKAIDDDSEELEELSKEICQNPELNFEEHYAHEKLTNFLESKGFNVTKKFVLETGFKAEITVLGTPAEEGGGGKIDLINKGVFDDVDVAMMVHPSPKTSSHVSLTAIDRVTVKYNGKAAHAAVYPWNGVNALDAAVLCYQTVSCLRQQMKPTWRVHGIIKNGGIKSNIIPDLSELEYSYRAPNKQELDQLKVKMRSCFDSAATGTGCQVSYEFSSKPYLNMVSNYRMADAFRSHAESLGVKFDAKEDEIGGSSDMGNVSQIVPSIHPLYNIETIHGNHTKDFTTASGDPKAQLHTLNQAKAMVLTCLDILTDENLLKEIRDEFALFKQNSQ